MNLASIVDGHDADRVALISRNRETTYGQLRDQIERLRGGLIERGVGVGDRVAILCGNNRFFVISYLAVVGAGAIAVPLNPVSPGPELRRELETVRPHTLIVGPTGLDSLRSVERSELPMIELVVAAEGDVPDGAISLDEVMSADPAPAVDMLPDDVAVMMFTSGTAGQPRAAMLSHHNLLVNLEQGRSVPDRMGADDVVYSVLPLFHIFGLNVVIGQSLSVGASILLVQRFDPATAVQSIVQRQVTVVPGAPPMWVAFSHFDDLPADTFRSVRLALSGAARLAPAVAKRMFDMFGVVVREGYGLTEASPVVTSSNGITPRAGSVGKVLAGVEVRLSDSEGADVIVGDSGEIWIRGENVFLGYFEDRAATDRVLCDGWLRTGDIGVVDEAGYLYLVDRAKDLIIVSGFNVFPAEVEDVLAQHPAVHEVGVLGVPHPHDGEAVKAYVVLEPGADIDEDTLIEYASDYLARYKCPTKIVFIDHLPRNASGKLIRRELEGTVLETH